MPPWFMALVFSALGALCVWSIQNDIRTGVASSRGWRFTASDSPIGFLLVIVGKAAALMFSVAVVLHAFGLAPDPIRWVSSVLPWVAKSR